jgi:hypothetical protein
MSLDIAIARARDLIGSDMLPVVSDTAKITRDVRTPGAHNPRLPHRGGSYIDVAAT